jgi:hypothetical protein
VSGDPLPYSSKVSGSIVAEKRFLISGSVSGFVGATAAYVGKRYEGFPGGPGQAPLSIPAYGYGNLRVGIVEGQYRVTAFVKNITNEQGVLASGQASGGPPMMAIWHTSFMTPRTVGLSVSRDF